MQGKGLSVVTGASGKAAGGLVGWDPFFGGFGALAAHPPTQCVE